MVQFFGGKSPARPVVTAEVVLRAAILAFEDLEKPVSAALVEGADVSTMLVLSSITIPIMAEGSFKMLARMDTAFGPFEICTSTSLSASSKFA